MNREELMRRALVLAKQGQGRVAPNPMVGCVIVYDDKIVAEGYHQKYGEAHAEVNAIAQIPKHITPSQCTLYVTLEPCSHFGKTPPCADLIIQKGFKKVVVAAVDPNPLVAGKGIQKLKDAGIAVDSGVLEKEAKDLNREFLTFQIKKRPYIVLKWAQSADGFIGRKSSPDRPFDNKISGDQAQRMVHELRAGFMGIMVGKNTVLNDNPHLTTRLVPGNNPIRLVIDQSLSIPKHFNVFNDEAKTIVFNGLKEESALGISLVNINFGLNILPQIMEYLYAQRISSVLVEGGSMLLSAFIAADLWDEAYVIENSEMFLGDGIQAPTFQKIEGWKSIGNDRFAHLIKPI